jgi:glycosyltransferase involved in cell wall biosynthesis
MDNPQEVKRILMIAPGSFPVTSAECIVNIKLLQAMTRCGQFEVDLISKALKWQDYPSDSMDNLGIRLNSHTVVIADNRLNVKTILQHIKCFLLFGTVYKGTHWAANAFPHVKKLVKSHKYDYILTKNESSFLLGYYFKKHNGIKWIATWNDPFPRILYPDSYIKYWNLKPMRSDKKCIRIIQDYTDNNIFPNNRLRDHLLKTIELPQDRTTVIPHVVLDNKTQKRQRQPRLKIIHSGNINYPRDPELFFTALENFFKNRPDALMDIYILGVTGQDIGQKISVHSLSGHVHTIAPVSYNTSIKMLQDYDVAVIIEAKCEEGIFLPTKVSDFMQEGIPVFAISPETGVLNDLHKNGNIPYFASNEDSGQIGTEIERLYQDYLDDNIGNGRIIPENYTEKSVTETYLSF